MRKKLLELIVNSFFMTVLCELIERKQTFLVFQINRLNVHRGV